MAWKEMFVVRPMETTGVFIAPQSITSFVLSTCIVVTISRAARTLAGFDSETTLVTFLVACAVGSLIVVVTLSATDTRPATVAHWARTITVAGLNCLLLYAAAVGIEKF